MCLENVTVCRSVLCSVSWLQESLRESSSEENCRNNSTKLSEISLVFVVSSNRCSVHQPGTLSLIYWPWIMQMCTPHTPSSPSANGTHAKIYSESEPSSIFPSFFISLLCSLRHKCTAILKAQLLEDKLLVISFGRALLKEARIL